MKKEGSNRITLIALVITIVILIILEKFKNKECRLENSIQGDILLGCFQRKTKKS